MEQYSTKPLMLCLLIFFSTTILFSQEKLITGTVTDSQGLPLPGVNVLVKNTSRGTQTNFDGEFSLEAAPGEILVFSFVGTKTIEKVVDESDVFNVEMLPDQSALDEVVVVGYGTVKKSDLTGAVSTVSSQDIVARGTTSPLSALQGQVAGANITANSGLPGAGFDINIRGVNSLTGGNPLFVVDGVMTDNIDFLNPMDIERIDVLKDASSTAIYGSRGSNGVVIVTTKSGNAMGGEVQFNYQNFTGIKTISNMPDFLNAEEGLLWTQNRAITVNLYRGEEVEDRGDYYHGFPAEGEDREYWENVLSNRNFFNWPEEILRPSVQTNHFLSASGGSETVNYMVGMGYQGDNGNIDGQYFRKYNFKGNIDINLDDKFMMGANINLAYSERELKSGNAMKQLFRMPHWAPAYDENGEVINIPMKGISGNTSPLAELFANKYNDRNYYVISNFYLGYQPVDWLSLKSTFSPNIHFSRHGEYWDPAQTKSGAGGQMSMNQDFSYIWDNHLQAQKDVGDHSFQYDFIYSMQLDRNEYLYGFGWDLPFNSEFYNLGSATYLNTSSNFQKSTLMSFTNRFNYSFKDKYLLTATARWDGSSKLAPGNKWASFPSAAVAWRMSEEEFLQDTDVNNLKLRLSYGYTGNNNIDPYTTQFSVSNQTYYDWNGTLANGFRPSAIANKSLTWERTREWNLGVDFGFLNNRISGEVNLYDRLSLNLLMSRKLAVPTGWGSMMDNVGSVSNKGVEVQLNTVNIETPDFSWQTNFTFSTNKNEIVELYGKKEDDVPNRWFIGQPVEVVYALVYDGVWQRDELTQENMQELEGTAKVKDLNGDGQIDIDNDMKVLGSPLPSWIGGLQTTFRYKNWDLSANLYTKQGVFIFSPFHELYTDMNTKQILDIDYYMRENPVTDANYTNAYPQPAYAGQYYGEDAEDYGFPGFNKDASFVRLQNVTLGYNFQQDVLNSLNIDNLRVYANAVNPKVWTDYEGFDPEWGSASMSSNANSFSTYQLGVNLSF